MSIPFDQYQRYKTLELLVNYTRNFYDKQTLKILEIGSNEQFNLLEFLPTDDITFSDLTLPKVLTKNVKFIQADATDLRQFQDSSFDIVLSSDVLEHISVNKREDFLKETNRVAKLASIHCFPNNTKFVKSAEFRCNQYYTTLYKEEHPWLMEHIKNGLPDKEEILSLLKKLETHSITFEHGDIFLWEKLTRAIFFSYHNVELKFFIDNIDMLYAHSIYTHDQGLHNYRIFLINSIDLSFCESVKIHFEDLFTKKADEYAINILENELEEIKYYDMNKTQFPEKNYANIFFNTGNGFNELEKQQFSYICYKNTGNIEFNVTIPNETKEVRFDCIEGKTCLLKNISFTSANKELKYQILNGTILNDDILFPNTDPQILIPIKEKVSSLQIKAKVKIFSENNNDILYLKSLIEENKSLQKICEQYVALLNEKKDENFKLSQDINCLSNALQANNLEIEQLKNQKIRLQNSLELYQKAYQEMQSSISWKVTKPLRTIRSLLKK